MSDHAFVRPGSLIFIDAMIVSAANWFYWLVMAQFLLTSEIGHAITVISLTALISAISQLGLEYPLVKKASKMRDSIFLPVLLITFLLALVSLPFVFYFMNSTQEGSLEDFTIIAIILILISPLFFVSRNSLLGVLHVKSIFITDIIAVGLKFLLSYIFVIEGFGPLSILLGFAGGMTFSAVSLMIIARRKFTFKSASMHYYIEILKEGLINLPSKSTRVIIFSYSVILLAWYGIEESSIGTYYIALMLTIMVGSFAANLAFMAIPSSTKSKRDLSAGSNRLGISITAPIIVVLLVAPGAILSLIGDEYALAENELVVLSLSILPFIIVINSITSFNNQKRFKELVIIGLVQLIVFTISFIFFVPQFDALGAAFSILLSVSVTAILSIFLVRDFSSKHIIGAIISIGGAWLIGSLLASLTEIHIGFVILASLLSCIAFIFAFKNLNFIEIKQIIKSIIKGY